MHALTHIWAKLGTCTVGTVTTTRLEIQVELAHPQTLVPRLHMTAN
jgi:hypothetical protein